MMYSKYSAPKWQKRQRGGLPKKLGLIFLTLTTTVLIVLKVATWLNASVIFSIKDIEIIGNKNAPRVELLSLFKIDTTQSLFEIDLKAIADKIKTHPFVHEAKVSRKLPNNIVVQIIEKQPLALVNGGKLALVDQHGDFLPELKMFDTVDFPIISNIAPVEPNNRKLMLVLNFLYAIKDQDFSLYSQISEISFSDKIGIYFYLIEGSTHVIVGNEGFVEKAVKLTQVMKMINQTTQFSQVKYFDLRFKNQVIVKEFNT